MGWLPPENKINFTVSTKPTVLFSQLLRPIVLFSLSHICTLQFYKMYAVFVFVWFNRQTENLLLFYEKYVIWNAKQYSEYQRALRLLQY